MVNGKTIPVFFRPQPPLPPQPPLGGNNTHKRKTKKNN